MNSREPEPKAAEYFCIPVLLAFIAVGVGVVG